MALVLLLAGIGCYYLGAVLTSRNRNRFSRQARGFHQMQAEAFLAGRLSLAVEPAPALLALPDPYDPAANPPYRVHDLSLYRGKYYLYWGPAPALVWFAPFRALTGFHFSENMATALFCWGGVVLSCLLLVRLWRRYLPQTPFWMVLAAGAALGVSNAAPWVLRRTAVYELSIAAAYLLTMAALYCLAGAGPLEDLPDRRLLGAGMLVAVAVATRLSAVGGAVMLAVVAWRLRGARRAALLFVPLLLCLGLLALYNRLRFDAWTESGLHYQLAASPMRHFVLFNPARIPVALYHYFLAPGRWTTEFPFLRVAPSTAPWRGPEFYYEPVAGLLRYVPFLNLLWLGPWLWRRAPELSWILIMTVGTALAQAILVSAAVGVAMRYELDFAGLLLLAAVLVWFYLDRRRPLLRPLALGALLGGMLAHAAFGLVGWDDSLRVVNPRIWSALRAPFAPVERALAPWAAGRYGPLRLRVEFARGEPGRCEPLVATGTTSEADLLAVRYGEPGRAAFGFVHLGGSGAWSDPVRVEAGRPYELRVHMGSLYPAGDRRYRLLLDGREVLSGEAEFYQSRREQVVVGSNYVATPRCGSEFRGRILEVLYDRNDDR